MKRSLPFLILLILAAPLFAQDKREPGKAVIYGQVVNLREAPNAQSKVIGQLSIGSTVEIVSGTEKKEVIGVHRDYWYQIKSADGKTGHVFGAYIALQTGDLGGGRTLLLGASDKKKGRFEFRILQGGQVLASNDFEFLGWSETEDGQNYFEKFEIHRDFFGTGHHVVELGSFAGIPACAGFASGAYLFSFKDKTITLISNGIGGADAPVSVRTYYTYKPGVITEIRENIEDQTDAGPVGTEERRTFSMIKGKLQPSAVTKHKIGKK